VFREAKALGVLQLGLSGGEPTLRPDLALLVGTAHGLGLYTSLITSGYRLSQERLAGLKAAGLDHVQISVQGAEADLSDEIAGSASYRDKIAAYHYTRELGFPLTVNVVLHRRNLHQVEALIRLAESLGAERIELANTQFYGWALHNRTALMPTRAQLDEAWRVVQRERARLGNKLEIVWVLPDYHEQYPKPCMGGWGRAYMTVTPGGEVWPCHAAGRIRTLEFANVRDHPLEWIWSESEAFNRFRGDAGVAGLRRQGMTAAAIAARGLGKDFGSIRALDALDLEVREGEFFGFLGPNGAGKTTTVHILATLLAPSRGAASVAGHDIV